MKYHASLLLLLSSVLVQADQIEIPLTIDGAVIDIAPYGTFDQVIEDASTLSLGNLLTHPTNASERRMVLELDLSLLPAGTINSAEIVLDGVSGTLGGMGILNFTGYVGDGAITLEDATRTGPILPNTIDDNNVSIDITTFLQNEVTNGSSYLGIVGRQFLLGINWNFIASEWDVDDRKGPTLVLDYTPAMSPTPELGAPTLVQQSGSLYELPFDTVDGYLYQVETATVLGAWQIGPSYFGNGGTQTYVFVKPQNDLFIRIGVTPF